MCFIAKKRLETLENKIDSLTKIIESNELVKLRETQRKFGEETKWLEGVKSKVKVKNAKYDKMNNVVNIELNLPNVELFFDDEGNVIENQYFKSINYLNLLDPNECKKVWEKLDEAKKENNL